MSTQPHMLADPFVMLIGKIKRLALRRGGENGLRSMLLYFGGNQQLSIPEFVHVLSQMGITLNPKETELVSHQFDLDGDGNVGVEEFMTALRGGLSAKRRTWITKAWKSLPKCGQETVELTTLYRNYNVSVHPDVISGKVTVEDLQDKFSSMFSDQTNPNGTVTRDEFELYYAGVSAQADNDEWFALVMNNCWNLADPKRTMNSTSTMSALSYLDGQAKLPTDLTLEEKEQLSRSMKHKDQAEKIIIKVRNYIQKRAGGFAGLGRSFRILDNDRSGKLNAEEFAAAIRGYGLPVDERDIDTLVCEFDVDGDGNVTFDEFLVAVRGEMAPRRKKLVERCFNKFDADGNGNITINDLRGKFQVKNHPLVASGRKTQDEVLTDFLNTFDDKDSRDGTVTYEEFEEYYAGISATIDNDKHFEVMLTNAWKL